MSRFSQFAGGGGTVGQISTFLAGGTPTGYLQLNGQCVSKTTYANLYAVVGDVPPPTTDSSMIASHTAPTGYCCSGMSTLMRNGTNCIGLASVYLKCDCTGTSVVCYSFINGCCGAVCISCGTAVNGSCVRCNLSSISSGYDCNTCKLYVSVNYTVNCSGSGTTATSVNMTDLTVTSHYCLQSCYGYSAGTFPIANSCIYKQTSSGPVCCLLKICYPTGALTTLTQCFYTNGGTNYSGCFAGGLYSSASEKQLVAYGSTAKNPEYIFISGVSSAGGNYYSGWCYCCGGIAAIDLTNNSMNYRDTGYHIHCIYNTSYSCVPALTYTGCYCVVCGGLANTCGVYTTSMGFYCDTSYVGITYVKKPMYMLCFGFYGGCCVNCFTDPVHSCIFEFKFSKSAFNTTAPIMTCKTSSDYSNGLSTACCGILSVDYIPKCNMFMTTYIQTASYPNSSISSSSPFIPTIGVSASNTQLPLSVGVNCLGLTGNLCSAVSLVGTQGLPYKFDSSALTVYGQSTLGAGSPVFLLPNSPHQTPALAYYIKT